MRARRRRLFLEALEDRRLLAAAPYQNAADPYDVNGDGAADGTDLWLLDTELNAKGERSLSNPNGPVQYFWDVNGDRDITWADLELDLRFQTGTLQGEAPKSGGGKTTGAGDGAITTLSGGYSVILNPVGNVSEYAPFSLTGLVSPTPPPNTMFMPTVNWGQSPGNGGPPMYVMINSSGQFQIPHIYFDDGASPGNGTPSDVETITLTGSIMGSPVSAQSTATANNVNPVPQLLLTNTNNPQGGPEWQVSGYVQDASPMDKHTVTIDWGDGSAPVVISNLSTNQPFPTIPPHRYLPRQIQDEGPVPYQVTASVVDDDTGTGSWSDDAATYLFDLDNDADNSWDINENDDPIEDVSPGRFLFANWDDNQPNGIRDLDEAPVSGEDDLEPFLVGWAPRPDFDYTGWHVTLHAMQASVSGTIWEFPDKSGVGVPFVGSGDLIFDWILDTQPIQETLYLEANAPGEIWLQLRLWTPNYGLTVEEDRVVFTALAPDPIVDMIIYDGQNGKEVRDEAVTGAVTVANLNDTDADGIPDRQDDIVKETRSGNDKHGRDELDLMKLEIKKPRPYTGGNVVLSVNKADKVMLWEKSTKETRVDYFNPDTGEVVFDDADWATTDVITVWVELLEKSATVADYVFTLTYGTAEPDVVKATGIWAELIEHETTVKTWDQLAGTVWRTEMEQRLQDEVKSLNLGNPANPVTGPLRPSSDGKTASFRNGILMMFEVSPKDVDDVIKRVKFDLTRQVFGRDWYRVAATGQIGEGANKIDWPVPWELPNDDPEDPNTPQKYGDALDESDSPNANGHMFVLDVPGIGVAVTKDATDKRWNKSNFYQFVRVSFTVPPEEEKLLGSICSQREEWSSRATVVWDDAIMKWKRTAAPEENQVTMQHIVADVP